MEAHRLYCGRCVWITQISDYCPLKGKVYHTMKRVLRFATSVILLVCASSDSGFYASAQQSSSASIVGRWRSLETSKGGIGAMFEFRSDGTVDFSPGAIVEMRWRIENNQLVLPPATVGGAEQKYSLQWLSNSKLGLKTEAGVTELTRVGDHSHADKPILGEWTEHREMDGLNLEAHWLFYLNSKLLFLMPFAIQHGSYTMSGSALHLKVPHLNPESRFEMKDNLLTLSELEGGHEDRYVRY
jgi:hypothetical protein